MANKKPAPSPAERMSDERFRIAEASDPACPMHTELYAEARRARAEEARLDADIERSAESRNRMIDDYEASLKKARLESIFRGHAAEQERDRAQAYLGDVCRERDAAEVKLKKAEEERDEERDWVRKMHREAQVLTCVYCGHAYPPGTPASGSEALTAHIKMCEKHPLRATEAKLKKAEEERDAWHERVCELERSLRGEK